MINVNEYFDGKVKSLALENAEGNVTIGVMEAGDYEFGTSSIEIMTVVSGVMEVKLPGENSYAKYNTNENFRVEKGVKFQVRLLETCAYKCQYL